MGADAEKTGRMWEIEQIYRTRLPELCRVAAAISGSRQAAPDLVHEAFVRAVQRLDSFRGDGPLEGWVWRIVVNVANHRHRQFPTLALPEEGLGASSTSSDEAGVVDLAAAMSVLTERQRLVLFLRYYADLDYATIAEALAISGGTVGATLTTARAHLGQALGLKEATSP
jgi:RNA polymerase sigma-70 factor, ECF subfamily